MRPPRFNYFALRLAGWWLLLLGAALWIIRLAPLDYSDNYRAYFCISLLLGTLFGITSVASIVVAAGPGPVWLRLPASLLTMTLMIAVFYLKTSDRGGPITDEIATISLATLAQWIVTQVLSWPTYWWLQRRYSPNSTKGAAPMQFGIARLMILTAFVALVLGVARYLPIREVLMELVPPGDPMIFLFLAGAAMVVTMPFYFCCSAFRLSLGGILCAIVWSLIVTLIGYGIFGDETGPNLIHLSLINCISVAWTVLFAFSGRTFLARLSEPEANVPNVMPNL